MPGTEQDKGTGCWKRRGGNNSKRILTSIITLFRHVWRGREGGTFSFVYIRYGLKKEGVLDWLYSTQSTSVSMIMEIPWRLSSLIVSPEKKDVVLPFRCQYMGRSVRIIIINFFFNSLFGLIFFSF